MAIIDNLLSYYKFDVNSSTQADSHGSNDGTVSGATYTASGKLTACYTYDGTNDSINMGDVLDAGTGAFSITGWFKTSNTGAWKNIVTKSDSGGGQLYEVRINDSNYLTGTFRNAGGADTCTSASTVTGGAWTFFALTRPASGGNVSLYVNDATVVTTTNNARDCDNAHDFMTGYSDGPFFPHNGEIDEVGVWNKELSAAEVASLYNGGDGFAYPFTETPVAAFSGTPLSGEVPIEVTFTDASTNIPTSWSWTFGDGGSSTDQNPTYEYTIGGTYTVSLTATNSAGSDAEEKTSYVSFTTPPPPPSTITVGSDSSIGMQELRTKYPYASGLTAGTTKQVGRKSNLVPQRSSTVSKILKTGL